MCKTIAHIHAPESTKDIILIPSTSTEDSLAGPMRCTNGSGLWYCGLGTNP